MDKIVLGVEPFNTRTLENSLDYIVLVSAAMICNLVSTNSIRHKSYKLVTTKYYLKNAQIRLIKQFIFNNYISLLIGEGLKLVSSNLCIKSIGAKAKHLPLSFRGNSNTITYSQYNVSQKQFTQNCSLCQ